MIVSSSSFGSCSSSYSVLADYFTDLKLQTQHATLVTCTTYAVGQHYIGPSWNMLSSILHTADSIRDSIQIRIVMPVSYSIWMQTVDSLVPGWYVHGNVV